MDEDFDYGYDEGDDLQNWETEMAWRDGQADLESDRERLEAGTDGQGGEFYGFCHSCGNELNKFDTCETCEDDAEEREMYAQDEG